MFIFSTLAVAASLVAAVAADHGHSLQARSHHHHVERSNLQKRFSGTATYYQTGTGACGQFNNPGDFIVALNSAQYGGGYPGPNCFKAISICAKGKCVGATIVDECPTCGYGSLDLSQGLFEQFASTDAGVFQMTWSFADGGGEPQPSTTKKPDPPAPTTTWKPEPSPEPTTTWKPEPTTTWKPEPTTTWKPEPTTTWEEPKTTSTKKASTSTPPPETTSHHEPSTTSTSSTPTSTSSTTSTSTVESTTSVSSSVAVSTSASVTGTESSAAPSATATSGSATGSGNNNSSGSGSNLADAQKIMLGMGRMVVAGKQ
ncbi:hypothetical protein RSOLAG1IB_00892 [Rhizoctonia solani AG-1 IB]|uniref:Uncharacterized protein n=1 Tax=Thanatephorus cucumeris (strain AG1-IB / isolate 7/3/14) TaxID=1108050 RepID=A0A0B7F7Y5_THACB|nr:hypothetical protein RSOLAG1IB_00892 [Rhizoctonia solani AG-1 IB]